MTPSPVTLERVRPILLDLFGALPLKLDPGETLDEFIETAALELEPVLMDDSELLEYLKDYVTGRL